MSRKSWFRKSHPLGVLGRFLCDRFYPRPATKSEIASNQQYISLVVNVLKGNCHDYGRDRGENDVPLVAERKDYAKIYGRQP